MNPSIQEGIFPVYPEDHPNLLRIWEASVRATHYFITESDIQVFKPLILDQAFHAVNLFCMRDSTNTIVGFLGVHDSKIEMLFIDPLWRGRSVGRQLLTYAVETLGATELDVNEQNEQALGFYQKFGFTITGRSALDSLGKPYPLLHMRYSYAPPL
ncbi:GNAT family N-acetyltransferase [Spirosoma soli]|uniref:GNAT family N-acetyltransferase n=1 Tax=Spirosoma soli TaxID=1770529 RepID=A0ABW5MB46_9BACT